MFKNNYKYMLINKKFYIFAYNLKCINMDAKIIAFANLKGGVGKSKLNSFFANFLASKGHMVLVIDGDVSQHTTEIYDRSDDLSEYLSVINYEFEDGDIARFVLNSCSSYDYVLVDIPGTIQQSGIVSMLSVFDALIIPTSVAEEDIHSTMKFIDVLKELKNNHDIDIPYKVLINKYEVQFSAAMREGESNNWADYKELFGEDKVFDKGVRLERSLFQNNFISGRYDLSLPNAKRVDQTMELIYEFVN